MAQIECFFKWRSADNEAEMWGPIWGPKCGGTNYIGGFVGPPHVYCEKITRRLQ